MVRVFLTTCAVLVILASCATPRRMTRDEFLGATCRPYPGVSESKFFELAERLFLLSDEKDTKFIYHGKHEMIVQHDWLVYIVVAATIGTDIWQIKTQPGNGGVKACVYVATNASILAATITGAGGSSITTVPTQNIVTTPAIYGLYWARMDYLLGKSEVWPTCKDWKARKKAKDTYGSIEALCLWANVKDLVPSKADSMDGKEHRDEN